MGRKSLEQLVAESKERHKHHYEKQFNYWEEHLKKKKEEEKKFLDEEDEPIVPKEKPKRFPAVYNQTSSPYGIATELYGIKTA